MASNDVSLFQNGSVEAIITFNPIYDKICKILENSRAGKTTIALNFLSTLLYVNDEEGQSRKGNLVAYARNMVRSSGCLSTMCELFTCMMNQDVWRALCRCLAESCRGIQANQSYCAHLIPTCVQKCHPRTIEVLVVLQSLLQNHTRNINLFIECNGMSLFKRELLQYEISLQLLATIAQSSNEAVELIAKTNISEHLRDFLLVYGPQSPLGQWATIVLYRITPVKAQLIEAPAIDDEKKDDIQLSESLLTKLQPGQTKQKEYSADTTAFFKTVLKEITNAGAEKEYNLKAFFPSEFMVDTNQRNSVKCDSRSPLKVSTKNLFCRCAQSANQISLGKTRQTLIANDSLRSNKTNELSLSFLHETHLKNKHVISDFIKPEQRRSLSFQRRLQASCSGLNKDSVYESLNENKYGCSKTFSTNEFKPTFTSTPRRHDVGNQSKYISQSPNDTSKTIGSRCTQQNSRKIQMKRRLPRMRVAKYSDRSKIDKEIKHKSFSGRVFDAINTTCTTLVKTVKNIFNPKNDSHQSEETSLSNTGNRDNISCSYSFTNYMRKRDSVLNKTNQSNNYSVEIQSKEKDDGSSVEVTNSCDTCNDTIELKRKLAKDNQLKRTIRKLKLGINLYGCDFKKISRIMWPKESYMTPAVLYNLYRKLITK
ncbi:uncharacterized protein LOC124644752 [Helicoverpa zea]|uniref:uncharacterized protein LOC124644752 n=1 Tax=Helicoverpa zea TaxID=7113 RepID=UPI001F5AFC37|nr:uncharacterized protein LOC124644752 [Helicoverpa zea]